MHARLVSIGLKLKPEIVLWVAALSILALFSVHWMLSMHASITPAQEAHMQYLRDDIELHGLPVGTLIKTSGAGEYQLVDVLNSREHHLYTQGPNGRYFYDLEVPYQAEGVVRFIRPSDPDYVVARENFLPIPPIKSSHTR